MVAEEHHHTRGHGEAAAAVDGQLNTTPIMGLAAAAAAAAPCQHMAVIQRIALRGQYHPINYS
jgi:hypothetical protein